MFHLGDKLQGLAFFLEINPYHALQVSNTYPSEEAIFALIRLNQLDVFTAKLNRSRAGLSFKSAVGANFPCGAYDPFATLACIAENKSCNYKYEPNSEYDYELFRSNLPNARPFVGFLNLVCANDNKGELVLHHFY